MRFRRPLVPVTMLVLVGLLLVVVSTTLWAQQEAANATTAAAASSDVHGMKSAISFDVIAWMIGVGLTMLGLAAGSVIASAKMQQATRDHMSNDAIHPTRSDLDEVYVRKDVCQERHPRK